MKDIFEVLRVLQGDEKVDDGRDYLRANTITVSEFLEYAYSSVDLSHIPAHILENARLRGEFIHSYLEERYGNEIAETEVPYEYMAHTVFLDRLIDKKDLKFIEFEQNVNNDWLRGRFDFIVEYKGKTYIGDLKVTNKLNRGRVTLQTTAYRLMLEDMGRKVDGQLVIHLTGKGASLEFLDYDIEAFEAVKKLMEFKRKHE